MSGLPGRGDPPLYEVLNPGGGGAALIACDHASRYIPAALHNLGLSPRQLQRHIAWDIGAAEVSTLLAAALDAPLLLANHSRLVVEAALAAGLALYQCRGWSER